MAQESKLEGYKATVHHDHNDDVWFVRLHHPRGSFRTICECEDEADALLVASSVATVCAASDVTWRFTEQDGQPTEIAVGNQLEFDGFRFVCNDAIDRIIKFQSIQA